MTNYFAVFDRQQNGANLNPSLNEPSASAKLLPYHIGESSSVPFYSGNIENARVVKLEASSVAIAQQAVRQMFGDSISGTPVIVEEAAFKES